MAPPGPAVLDCTVCRIKHTIWQINDAVKLVLMPTGSAKGTTMRVTAIRVGADLWRLLEAEAARVGVSVSQYVREAALMRAAAAATARGEDAFTLLARAAAEVAPSSMPETGESARTARRRKVRAKAREMRSDARALQAESRQARSRSHQLRTEHQDNSGA